MRKRGKKSHNFGTGILLRIMIRYKHNKWRFLFLLIISLFPIYLHSQCTPGVFCSEKKIAPFDPTYHSTNARPKSVLGDYCYDINTLALVPCKFEIQMAPVKEIICQAGANVRCGHISGSHDPDQSTDFAVIGCLTETNLPNCSYYLIHQDPNPTFQPWSYKYYSGFIMEDMIIKHKAENILEKYKFLSPPCDSEDFCTDSTNIEIGFQHLKELPKAIPQFPGQDLTINYTRCGLMGSCGIMAQIDNPYCWAAHPTISWATEEFQESLNCLAMRWYDNCSRDNPQPIGITDISLPGGGLLDIHSNWVKPHARHRHGTEADLDGNSVPWWDANICGFRPISTKDTNWLDYRNPLWNDITDIGQLCHLTYPTYSKIVSGKKKIVSDAGHVCAKKSGHHCQ